MFIYIYLILKLSFSYKTSKKKIQVSNALTPMNHHIQLSNYNTKLLKMSNYCSYSYYFTTIIFPSLSVLNGLTLISFILCYTFMYTFPCFI